MLKKLTAFASLFTSLGTLLCCALPALFVTLGFGSTFAALTNALPQLYTLTANKSILFVVAGSCIVLSLVLQRFFSVPVSCDLNGGPCEETKTWSKPLLYTSIFIYIVGGSFAYIVPLFM